ncbi:MAG: hypothetical protein ACLFNB_03805 [Candidatus Woesearchaeota archaeon]
MDHLDMYMYGQYSLLENSLIMRCDTTKNILTIEHYYHRFHRSTRGTCSELANFHALLEKSSFESVFIASCHEPMYFSKGTHFVVMANNSGFHLPRHGITSKLAIDTIIGKDTFLIDPSFSVSGLWPEAGEGYEITRLVNASDKENRSYAVFRGDIGNTKPLGLDGDRLISIGLEPGEGRLSVYGRTPGEDNKLIARIDKAYGMIGDKDINAMIEKLVETPVFQGRYEPQSVFGNYSPHPPL